MKYRNCVSYVMTEPFECGVDVFKYFIRSKQWEVMLREDFIHIHQSPSDLVTGEFLI